MPTELNAAPARRRARPRADLVDRVRAQRRPAAAAAAALRLVRGRGRLDPARRAQAARAGAHGRGHAGERDLGRADEGAAARGDARAARRGGRRDAADRRRGAEERVRGPDAAPRPRPPLARAHRPADGLRRLGLPGAGRPPGWPSSSRRSSTRCCTARAEPEQLAYEASERYGYPAGFLARYFEKLRYRFGPRERAGLLTFLELARDVGELDEVPELRFVSRAEATV